MTVRATPVKMVGLALMASTPTNVFVAMDGKEHIVKRVSYSPFSTQKELLGEHWEGMAGTVFKITVTNVNKLCFKGHGGPGTSTEFQAFVLELKPNYKIGLELEPGSLTVQFPALSFG